MSRIRKRFEKILQNPKDIKWDELTPVLRFFDIKYEKPDGGSHWTVYHDSLDMHLSVPVHNNRVKPYYIKKIIEMIEEVKEED